jgi:2-polyprenyl-3-methyl-5-hydroxy-6-metoxy-1,4-benzoquinol methylase
MRWEGQFDFPNSKSSFRFEFAAQMLKKFHASSVIDIGAGNLELKKYIGVDVSYTAVDCVKRDDLDHIIDLNKDKLPSGTWDAAVCLGVFEYVKDISAAIRELSEKTTHIVITYHGKVDKVSIANREELGWVSHITKQDFIGILNLNGFSVKSRLPFPIILRRLAAKILLGEAFSARNWLIATKM